MPKRGQQTPRHGTKRLHELLTSEVMHGAEIEFPLIGLVYVVGEGWRDDEVPVSTDEAHERLREWWADNLTHKRGRYRKKPPIRKIDGDVRSTAWRWLVEHFVSSEEE